MKGRMNAVFDRSNGAGASSVSFSTSNHSDSSAGTDRFLGNLNDKAKTRSSSAFQLDDGKMLSVIEASHHETNNVDIFSSGFKAGRFILDPEVHVHGDTSAEGLMRTMLVVPVDVESNFPTDAFLTQRNKNTSGAFVLHGAYQSLDDGDAPIFANSAYVHLEVECGHP